MKLVALVVALLATTLVASVPAPVDSGDATAAPFASEGMDSAAPMSPTATEGSSPSPSASAPTAAPPTSATSAAPSPSPERPPPKEEDPAWVLSYSYSQAPLPSVTATQAPHGYRLGADYEHSPEPTTRRYTFNIDYAAGAPDGFHRRMRVVNNQHPGPMIEATVGDTIEVTVHNNMPEPQSMHWHGISQNGSNWADGPTGVTQCPIPPYSSFVYRFKADYPGTRWWHSHHANTMADGISGGLFIHDPFSPLQKGRDYDEDQAIFLADWQHDDSYLITEGVAGALTGNRTQAGYRGTVIGTPPDALLFNGRGQCNCSVAQPGVQCDSDVRQTTYKIREGKTNRFRLVHSGPHLQMLFSIDKHMLAVVETDSTLIETKWVTEILISPGQRFSILVKADQGTSGDGFYMRARNVGTMIAHPTWHEARATLRYVDEDYSYSCGEDTDDEVGDDPEREPEDTPWPDLADWLTVPCDDFAYTHRPVYPLTPAPVPQTVYDTKVLDSRVGKFLNPYTNRTSLAFQINNVSFTNFAYNPFLGQVGRGETIDPHVITAVTFPDAGAVDMVLNQRDPWPLAHPFHLHGREFFVLATGEGALALDDVPNVELNLANPVLRDTLSIGSSQWAIIRLPTDTPGVWAFHCHIAWHLSVGKMALVIVRPDDVVEQAKTYPPEWSQLCAGTDPGQESYR